MKIASKTKNFAISFVHFFKMQVPYHFAVPIFVVLFALFSASVIPILVTVDGIIYIANAKSLLTNDFGLIYTIYREPGYPLLLKSIHFFGDAGLLIVFVQSALIALAGMLVLFSFNRVVGRTKPTFGQLIFLGLMLINPMFLSYSGAVLQQSLFCFQLAGFVVFISFGLKQPSKFSNWITVSFAIIWYLSSIATSIGWLYLGLIPTATTLFLATLPILKKATRKFANSFLVMATILTVVLVVSTSLIYQLGRQTYKVWETIKTPYITSASKDGYVIKPLETVPYIPTPVEMLNRTLSLMNMTVIEPYEKENDLFMGIQMKRQSPSSTWDSAFESEPQASYALNYFIITNPGATLHNGYARLGILGPVWYQTGFMLMWLTTLLLALARNWRPMLLFILVPINFLLVYAASNSPIDRYGVPAYIFASAATVILPQVLVNVLNLIKSNYRK